jgi:ABC-type glycerol-3-phosphate transport system substrate-binding protein
VISRRQMLKGALLAAAGGALAACQPKTVIVEVEKEKIVKETVEVEVEKEKIVKETVVVKETVQVAAAPADITLTIMHVHPFYEGFGAETVDPAYMEANPNIKIERQLIPGWINEFYPKLMAMYAAGETFDAAQLPHAAILYSMYSKGIFRELTPYMSADNFDMDQFFAPCVEGAKFPTGAIFMVPLLLDNGNALFLYNKDMLAAAGLEEPKKGSEWNWDDYAIWAAEAAAAITDVIPIYNDWASMYAVESLLAAWGGARFLDDAGQKCLVDQPDQTACLTYFDASVRDGWNARSSDLGGFHRNLFQAGTIALITDFWPVVGNVKNNPDVTFEVGAVTHPQGPGPNGQSAGSANMHFMGVGGNSENPGPAWQYVKYYTGPDSAEPLWELGAPLATKSVWSGKWLEDPLTAEVHATFDSIRPPSLPWNFRSNEIGDAYSNNVTAVIDGGLPIKDGIIMIKDAVDAVLARPMA